MSHGMRKQHLVHSVVCSYSAVEQYNVERELITHETALIRIRNIHNAALSGPHLLLYSYYIKFVSLFT